MAGEAVAATDEEALSFPAASDEADEAFADADGVAADTA